MNAPYVADLLSEDHDRIKTKPQNIFSTRNESEGGMLSNKKPLPLMIIKFSVLFLTHAWPTNIRGSQVRFQ